MATTSPRKSSWLALLAGLTTVTAQSAFWTYTSRFQDCESTYSGLYSTYGISTSCRIKNTVTPTVTPYETSTDDIYTYYTDLVVVDAWYTSGAVPDSDLLPLYDYDITDSSTGTSTYTYYDFSMEVTYTAPGSCPTPFTVTTNASVTVPTQVLDQITPSMVITSTPAPTRRATVVYETWYLAEGQAPFTSEEDYYYSAYIADCTSPYDYSSPTYTGSTYGGDDDDDDDDDYTGDSGSDGTYSWEVCYFSTGCTSVRIWVIIIATIIPTLFVLGFLESYFWFRRLMLGKGCLRFGTISWICISLWVACFTRSQSRRSPEDQKLLREKWKQTSFGTAIKLWFKWGFRHRYPTPLLGQYSRNTVGIVPEGQPLPAPGMVQTNGTYPGGPPPPPGAFIPNGAAGQYYTPPQGWVPLPNGQGYQMPPQGQGYPPQPGQNGVVQYYGTQTKDAPSITTTSVPPVQGAPQPVPSPVSPAASLPPSNVAEAPTQTQESDHAAAPQAQAPAQLPSDKPSAT